MSSARAIAMERVHCDSYFTFPYLGTVYAYISSAPYAMKHGEGSVLFNTC